MNYVLLAVVCGIALISLGIGGLIAGALSRHRPKSHLLVYYLGLFVCAACSFFFTVWVQTFEGLFFGVIFLLILFPALIGATFGCLVPPKNGSDR